MTLSRGCAVKRRRERNMTDEDREGSVGGFLSFLFKKFLIILR